MKKSAIFIMAMLLTMPLISCVSERIVEKKIVPDLHFPLFPKMETVEEGGVSFSKDSVINLAEYKILIEETEKNYNEMKELYNEP